MSTVDCPDDFHRENGSFTALKKKQKKKTDKKTDKKNRLKKEWNGN